MLLERRRRRRRQVLLLLLLLAVTAASPLASAKRALDDIEESIYTTIEADDACVTLLNRERAVGCSTDGSRIGRLHRVRSLSELQDLLASNLVSGELLALLMPRELLRHSNLPILRQLALAGILLEPIAPMSTPYSPAARSPLRHLAPTASAPFDWNPHGDALLEEQLHFAVLQVSERSWPSMRQRAEANADGTASGNGNFVEFRYVMKALSNSVECLRDDLCIPVGNVNVWASLGGPRAENLSKPIALATAALDASALFHTLARGADADASGLVALLAAADAVAKLGWTELRKLEKQIVVTLFNAEAFDLIGSRSFVKDISGSFRCERASSTTDRVCIKPFRSDRAFENIALDKVEALLELNQVGLERQPLVFAHSHDSSAAHSLLSHLRTASASSGIELRTPSNVSNRLPPSSAWSFVSQVPDIATIVLAEHDAEYSNPFYHSVLDRSLSSISVARLCQLSTMTARTLLLSAGASNDTAASVSSNCSQVEELLHCLTSNFDCPLSRRLLPASVLSSSLPDVRLSASRGTSRYAGVYEPRRILDGLVGGATRLVFEQLQESSADLESASTVGANVCESASDCANGEWCRSGKCAVRTTHYHDAVDPALAFDATTGTWSIVDLHSNSRIWCESKWTTLMSRTFTKESPLSAHLMLFGGVLIVLLTLLVVKRVAPLYAANRFKLD